MIKNIIFLSLISYIFSQYFNGSIEFPSPNAYCESLKPNYTQDCHREIDLVSGLLACGDAAEENCKPEFKNLKNSFDIDRKYAKVTFSTSNVCNPSDKKLSSNLSGSSKPKDYQNKGKSKAFVQFCNVSEVEVLYINIETKILQ